MGHQCVCIFYSLCIFASHKGFGAQAFWTILMNFRSLGADRARGRWSHRVRNALGTIQRICPKSHNKLVTDPASRVSQAT